MHTRLASIAGILLAVSAFLAICAPYLAPFRMTPHQPPDIQSYADGLERERITQRITCTGVVLPGLLLGVGVSLLIMSHIAGRRSANGEVTGLSPKSRRRAGLTGAIMLLCSVLAALLAPALTPPESPSSPWNPDVAYFRGRLHDARRRRLIEFIEVLGTHVAFGAGVALLIASRRLERRHQRRQSRADRQ